MGTASAVELSESRASDRAPQLWLWPNLLSLDAPIVAVVWQLLFLRCFHLPVDPLPLVLLSVTVWLIYAADRTMDAFSGERSTRRHRFYRENWRWLLPVWVALLGAAGWLSLTRLSPSMLHAGFLLLGAVALYFCAVHSAPSRVRGAWPKEAAVGALFALGASLGAWQKIQTGTDAAAILVFSCLCWINCAAIDRWEGERWNRKQCADEEIGSSQTGVRWAKGMKWPLGATALGIAGFALIVFFAQKPALAGAEMASAFAFLALELGRRRLSADALRVLADVALLSPLLFLPIAGAF